MKNAKPDDFNPEDRIHSVLLSNHIHFLSGDINEESISKCIKWLIYESIEATPEKVLTLYINSEGGELYQAFALISIMRNCPHVIKTIAIGSVMSAGFLIFASGTKGERYITKHTGAMCHQFSDATEGKFHDIKTAMYEAEMCNQRMIDILQRATGLPATTITEKLLPASDVYFSAKEMVDLGVADHII